MRERFKSPCPLPTPRERELLTILIEEAAEVQQRATKMLRFGRDEIQPGQSLTNAARLGAEIGDLMEMIDMLLDAKLVDGTNITIGKLRKREKLVKYLQTETV